ncbi:MAG: histidine phosphatase family protein [Planctomycetota bacterium]
MHLFITRHGKAHVESASGRDEDRTLRGRGERQARFLGEHFAGADLRPGVVYSSGLVRSEQTADIVAEIIGATREREPVLGLGHRATDVIEALELIRRKDDDARVMLVGHNPQLESLVAVLSGGPTAPVYRMRTGTCVVLRTMGTRSEDGQGLIGRAEILDEVRLDD